MPFWGRLLEDLDLLRGERANDSRFHHGVGRSSDEAAVPGSRSSRGRRSLRSVYVAGSTT